MPLITLGGTEVSQSRDELAVPARSGVLFFNAAPDILATEDSLWPPDVRGPYESLRTVLLDSLQRSTTGRYTDPLGMINPAQASLSLAGAVVETARTNHSALPLLRLMSRLGYFSQQFGILAEMLTYWGHLVFQLPAPGVSSSFEAPPDPRFRSHVRIIGRTADGTSRTYRRENAPLVRSVGVRAIAHISVNTENEYLSHHSYSDDGRTPSPRIIADQRRTFTALYTDGTSGEVAESVALEFMARNRARYTDPINIMLHSLPDPERIEPKPKEPLRKTLRKFRGF